MITPKKSISQMLSYEEESVEIKDENIKSNIGEIEDIILKSMREVQKAHNMSESWEKDMDSINRELKNRIEKIGFERVNKEYIETLEQYKNTFSSGNDVFMVRMNTKSGYTDSQLINYNVCDKREVKTAVRRTNIQYRTGDRTPEVIEAEITSSENESFEVKDLDKASKNNLCFEYIYSDTKTEEGSELPRKNVISKAISNTTGPPDVRLENCGCPTSSGKRIEQVEVLDVGRKQEGGPSDSGYWPVRVRVEGQCQTQESAGWDCTWVDFSSGRVEYIVWKNPYDEWKARFELN